MGWKGVAVYENVSRVNVVKNFDEGHDLPKYVRPIRDGRGRWKKGGYSETGYNNEG